MSSVSALGAWVRAGLVVLVVIAVDQLSKHLVRHSIVPGEERKVLPGIQLVNTRNHGVAFGFLPGDQHRRHDRDRRSRCSRCSSTSRGTPRGR